MCGIVGVVRFDRQPVDEPVLARMVSAIRSRGPDGQGLKVVASSPVSVGLGHARLKIIDLSDQAAQPMANDDQSIWVTFNGELYNYRAVRATLQRRGVSFRSASDTEVLLRLYEAEGERCLEEMDGMFAFAIWDGPRQRLLLGRDRVGKKPLFYCVRPGFVAFASEIKALLQHPDIPAEVDEQILPAFFLYGYTPAPRTLYRDIHSLPPGHCLQVSAEGHLRLQRYWDVPLHEPGSGPILTEAEAAARVRELVTEAVRRRLIADVPLGAFLSGGVDSSIIVGLMSRLMDQPVRTFSIGFSNQPRFDETAYARLVSERFRTQHTEFVVEPQAVELIERLVWHHDGPFADSSAIPTYVLSRLTRQHVTVALNGDGGDELFAGYLRFYATLLAEQIPAWMRRSAAAALNRLPALGGHRSLFQRMQKFAGSAALPWLERFCRWNAVFYEDLPHLLPSLRTAGGVNEPSRVSVTRPEALSVLDSYLSTCKSASMLSQLLYLNMKTYLLDDLLVKMDRCSMAHALEARSPFLDRALIEYVCRLPDRMKLNGRRTKYILRRAFADLLPPAVLRRGKMGFGVPLRAWFAQDLREYLQDLLLAPTARLRAYVDQAYVRRLCTAHNTGRSDHSTRLWTLLTFEVWLRQLPSWGPGSQGYDAPLLDIAKATN